MGAMSTASGLACATSPGISWRWWRPTASLRIRPRPRRAFPPKLFGLDVLVDADGEPWLIEAQRKPALGGSALVQRINGQMFRTIFEMSCGHALDDSMPADRIALLVKDPAALAAREAEHEAARRGLFAPLA
jgi:hypothetical protein